MWNFCNFEKILNNNSDKIKDYMIEKYDEDSDTFIKNNINDFILNICYKL